MKKTIVNSVLMRATMTLAMMLVTIMAWAEEPSKYLDACTGGAGFIYVQGWAYDPDASAESIDVQVYVYTDAGCTSQYGDTHTINADVPRADVNSARNITGNHGFKANILVNDVGDYWVKVFAIDTNGDGNPQIGNTINVTVTEPQNYTAQDGDVLTGSTSSTVTIDDGASITLNGATINGGIVCEGTATITLVGTNSVAGADQKAGIQAGGTGTTLTIQGDGSLTATGGMGAAGIGTRYNGCTCGDIIISGGVVTATGGENAAGIGSGSLHCICGDITISGGVVNATTSVINGAGIGTGYNGSTCGDITITGGVVNATGGERAAGIGTGYYGSTCGNITISGGVVTATAGERSAGIGTGYYDCTCGDITITEDASRYTVTGGAESSNSIGAGNMGSCGTVTIRGVVTGSISQNPYTYVKPTDLTLTGGNYTAQDGDVLFGSTSGTVMIADGASITLNGATINGGIVCAGTATITLAGTNSVTGAYQKAGIQAGGTGTTLTIQGDGSLTVTGGYASAGIGLSSEWNATGGDIVILGGTITATGGAGGAGIGTCVIYDNGSTYSLNSIIIKGGTVTANGVSSSGWTGNGIGTGYVYINASCTIDAVKIYDTIELVDALNIQGSVTYMHGETDVTASASEYFTFIEYGGRRIIAPKDDTDYTITIADGIEHGTITGATTAKYGDKVTITATPDFGYHLSCLVVKDAQNDDVASTSNFFIMPKSNVTVSAVFEQGTHGTTEFALAHFGGYGYVMDATIYDGLTTVNLQKNTSYYIINGEVYAYDNRKFLLENNTYDVNIPYAGGTGTFQQYGNPTSFQLNDAAEAGYYDITMDDISNGKWNISIMPTVPAVDDVPNQEYTGGEITPEPLVMAGSLNITKGTDYEYSYDANTHVGTAKVIVTFKGTYASLGSVEKEFVIYMSSLADGTAYNIERDGIVTSVTYTKTLGAERIGKHQAWLVPFDYTITAADEAKFTFYKINMIANSPSPSVEASDEVWVFLTKLNAGDVLHANMPYVYKPKEVVTDYPFTSTDVTLKAKNTDVLAKTETLEDIYSFYGTYENTTPAASDPFYYVGIDGNLSLGNNGNVTVGPYRWILRKTSKYGGTSAYSPKMHFFDPEEDDITAISSERMVNGQSSMVNGTYDLSGRRLNVQSSMFNAQLPKGIYIVNGRKVFIK